MPISKKHLFLFAGIGLAVSGVATILFIYQGMMTQASSANQSEFSLERIHSVRMATHDHVPIAAIKGGQEIIVPENIGIFPELWNDHSLDSFGPGGVSPMHTHDTTGTIHIESTVEREFTLGEFLRIWGIAGEVEMVVDAEGQEIQDYENHVLRDNEGLVLVLKD